jgi:DNA-binding transcriptional ArsR family regulator
MRRLECLFSSFLLKREALFRDLGIRMGKGSDEACHRLHGSVYSENISCDIEIFVVYTVMTEKKEEKEMPGDINIVPVALLLADPTRASILQELSDGRTLPAGELARRAHVTPSTASAHLFKLIEAGLLAVEKRGKHRYYRIANPAIVPAIEALAALAPARPVRSLRESQIAEAVRNARMCYNHLAGNLGVKLSQALVDKQVLDASDDGYSITQGGLQWLSTFGIDEAVLKKQGSLVVPHHIDWSERRPHIAGELGAALARRLFDLEWITRTPSSRAVRLTATGQQALGDDFAIHA